MRRVLIAVLLASVGTPLVVEVAAAAVARPRRGVLIQPARYRRIVRFQLSYAGSGSYGTSYRSTPPNQGGNPDHDTAHDSSTQHWSLTFATPLRLQPCTASGQTEPCQSIGSITGARGTTAVTARISHVHVDGLFADQNASERCRLTASTPSGTLLAATVELRYDPARRVIMVTALDPVSAALALLPAQCPNQGDPLDGLASNYFGPGFSFDPAYGPDRWFTSRTVAIPLRVLHRAAEIQIRLSPTAAGTPPRTCDVPDPAYEHCTTSGSWHGVLTLRLET